MAIGNNRPEPDPFKPCSYIPQPGPITRYDPQRASSEYQGFAEPSDSGQGGGGSQIEPSVFGKQAVVEGDDPGASYSTGVNGAYQKWEGDEQQGTATYDKWVRWKLEIFSGLKAPDAKDPNDELYYAWCGGFYRPDRNDPAPPAEPSWSYGIVVNEKITEEEEYTNITASSTGQSLDENGRETMNIKTDAATWLAAASGVITSASDRAGAIADSYIEQANTALGKVNTALTARDEHPRGTSAWFYYQCTANHWISSANYAISTARSWWQFGALLRDGSKNTEIISRTVKMTTYGDGGEVAEVVTWQYLNKTLTKRYQEKLGLRYTRGGVPLFSDVQSQNLVLVSEQTENTYYNQDGSAYVRNRFQDYDDPQQSYISSSWDGEARNAPAFKGAPFAKPVSVEPLFDEEGNSKYSTPQGGRTQRGSSGLGGSLGNGTGTGGNGIKPRLDKCREKPDNTLDYPDFDPADPPTTRPDDSPLQDGDTYWDEDEETLYTWEESDATTNPDGFPANPSDGDTFTDSNGQEWEYDGPNADWFPTTKPGGGPLTDGYSWYNSDDGILYEYQDPIGDTTGLPDGDSFPPSPNDNDTYTDTSGKDWQYDAAELNWFPTTNPGGGPLDIGDYWFDTESGTLYQYNGTDWVSSGGANNGWEGIGSTTGLWRPDGSDPLPYPPEWNGRIVDPETGKLLARVQSSAESVPMTMTSVVPGSTNNEAVGGAGWLGFAQNVYKSAAYPVDFYGDKMNFLAYNYTRDGEGNVIPLIDPVTGERRPYFDPITGQQWPNVDLGTGEVQQAAQFIPNSNYETSKALLDYYARIYATKERGKERMITVTESMRPEMYNLTPYSDVEVQLHSIGRGYRCKLDSATWVFDQRESLVSLNLVRIDELSYPGGMVQPEYAGPTYAANQEIVSGNTAPEDTNPNWAAVGARPAGTSPYSRVINGSVPVKPELVDDTGATVPPAGLPANGQDPVPLVPVIINAVLQPRLQLNINFIKNVGWSWDYGSYQLPSGLPLDLGSITAPYAKDYDFTGIVEYNEPAPVP